MGGPESVFSRNLVAQWRPLLHPPLHPPLQLPNLPNPPTSHPKPNLNPWKISPFSIRNRIFCPPHRLSHLWVQLSGTSRRLTPVSTPLQPRPRLLIKRPKSLWKVVAATAAARQTKAVSEIPLRSLIMDCGLIRSHRLQHLPTRLHAHRLSPSLIHFSGRLNDPPRLCPFPLFTPPF